MDRGTNAREGVSRAQPGYARDESGLRAAGRGIVPRGERPPRGDEASDRQAGGDLGALRYDDDAITNVVAVTIGLVDAGAVHEPNAVADARILVHDHPLE